MTDNNNEVGNIVQSHPLADTGSETTESDNSVCPISSLKEACLTFIKIYLHIDKDL